MAYNCNVRKQKKVTVSIRTTIAHNGKRSSIDKPTPELATLKVLAEFYKGILGLENGIDENFKNNLAVLDKTHKVFLNPTSVKQILLSDKNDPLPLTEPVGVSLQDFKTEILKLQTNAKNLQNEEQACALKMILNALENLNLLSIEQIADIYYVFGKDIMVDDKQMKEILISMTNNGFFVPDDTADYMQKFKEFPEKTINWKTVTKVIVPEIIIGADGEMSTKRNVDESQNKLLPEIVHIYIDPKTNAIKIIDKN
ncbi:Fatty acid oxidation complex subunit alpha [Trichinella spiralis]|uniref:Fatty acid oxidation complex subunit alpha n=1 Tax=Trichinella spiralis TaxID=6334 RepID=A0ABR3KAZ7_TRISP